MNVVERCNVQEHLNGDDDLSTCNDTEDEKSDENFMSRLAQQTKDSEDSETEVDVQTESLELPEAKIKDAIIALEDVQNFRKSQGHASTSMSRTYIRPAVDAVTSLQITSIRQSTLHDYFELSF